MIVNGRLIVIAKGRTPRKRRGRLGSERSRTTRRAASLSVHSAERDSQTRMRTTPFDDSLQHVRDDQIELLLRELLPGVRFERFRLGGEPHDGLLLLPAAGDGHQDVVRANQLEGERFFFLLDLLGGFDVGPIVGDGRGHHHDVHAFQTLQDRVFHLSRGLDADGLDPVRVRFR